MQTAGFARGKSAPTVFFNAGTKTRCVVHGDDLVSAGRSEDLKWLKEQLKERFDIKTTTVGHKEEEGEVQEARIPNRVIRVTPDG